jgi:outer membrane murein-binding lipoprotein Lpp
MGGRVDRINAQQAELDHKMGAFKKDFAGQIFKIRASLDVLASQIIEIRAAVHVLEEGFREHERQLAQ